MKRLLFTALVLVLSFNSFAGYLSVDINSENKESIMFLYKMNQDNQPVFVDSIYTSFGQWVFNKAPGKYIYVVHNFSNSFNTYSGDKLIWEEATVYEIINDVDTVKSIVTPQTKITATGNGSISGSIDLPNARVQSLAGISIILTNASGAGVATTYTNEAGEYTFNNLAIQEYKVYVNNLGWKNTNVPTVTLSAETPRVQNVSLEIQSIAVVTSNINESISKLSIYPNPVQQFLTISNGKNTETVIYNENGLEMLRTTSVSSIDCSNLSAGLYTVNIFENKKLIHQEKMIKQ